MSALEDLAGKVVELTARAAELEQLVQVLTDELEKRAAPRALTPGRIVLYRDLTGHVWPAIVTRVRLEEAGGVDLFAFSAHDHFPQPRHAVPQVAAASTMVGWFWPARV